MGFAPWPPALGLGITDLCRRTPPACYLVGVPDEGGSWWLKLHQMWVRHSQYSFDAHPPALGWAQVPRDLLHEHTADNHK